MTPARGFNPSWQRHRFAYRAAAALLPAATVLDVACGVGHSFDLLAPRETVGIDLDEASLAHQDRATVVADMRDLPLPDGAHAALVCMHGIEHVPDPERAMREFARVLCPHGMAILVTPNRLTFGRPDEIIDPYHHVEFDPRQLEALCRAHFERVSVRGIFGSARQLALVNRERRSLDRILALDRLGLRRRIPRVLLQWGYDVALTLARRRDDPAAAAIGLEDFELRVTELDSALDLMAICELPHAAGG